MPFQVIRSDITKIQADIIVNTANPKPMVGAGVDAAIYKAAGAEQLLAERQKIGDIAVGHAEVTSALALQARYILHTAGPVWRGGEYGEEKALRSCYKECLKKAEELNCESIAFPLISTGTYGFPREKALQIAVSMFYEYLLTGDLDILLVVYDEKSYEISSRIFSDIQTYIEENAAGVQSSFGVMGERPFERREALDYSNFPEDTLLSRDTPKLYEQEEAADECSEDGFHSCAKVSSENNGKHSLSLPTFAQSSRSIPQKAAPSFWKPEKQRQIVKDSLEDALDHKGVSFQDTLIRMMNERQLQNVDVYRAGNLKKQTFSKIFSKQDYHPSKNTVCCLALSMRLSVDETNELMETVGMVLSRSEKFDLAIRYFLEHRIYNVILINIELDRLHLEQLGQKTE